MYIYTHIYIYTWRPGAAPPWATAAGEGWDRLGEDVDWCGDTTRYYTKTPTQPQQIIQSPEL